MLLINCGIKIMLTWFENCFIWSNAPADKKKTTFVITDTKLYVPVETLSTSDNTKLLQQLKLVLRRIIAWTKYLSKVSTKTKDQYLNYLFDPILAGVSRLFFHLKAMHTEDTFTKGKSQKTLSSTYRNIRL